MRALLSVYDKTGVVELASGLSELGWELVSSGGTARTLADAGLPVIKVSDVTGYPEMLGHRVVTLHPAIHGGILADPDVPEHRLDLENNKIDRIDLVVSNLYPFGTDPSIEMIDIGGPAMVRAAAKNHAHVGVVVDPADYGPVLEELRSAGRLGPVTRRALARKAFAHTASYDAAIVGWLDADELFPPTLHFALERTDQALRYGENPHQSAALYRPMPGSESGSRGLSGKPGKPPWWDVAELRGGIPLSYLNIYDADAAMHLVYDLGDGPAAVIVKHANPCGVAIADDLERATSSPSSATSARRSVESSLSTVPSTRPRPREWSPVLRPTWWWLPLTKKVSSRCSRSGARTLGLSSRPRRQAKRSTFAN